MRRTYEWKIKDGEIVWSQWIVPTEKTPIFKVAAVEIDDPSGYLCLIIRGEGIIDFHTPFHDGTVWVWQERPL